MTTPNPLLVHNSAEDAVESILEGFMDVMIAVFEFILGLIAGALWVVFSMLIEGLGWLYLNTPHPTDSEGNPTLWNPDEIDSDVWESGYAMYTGEIMPVAIGLFVVAFILHYFGHLIKHFPGMKNQPDIGRVLFLLLLVLAWWTVMTGILTFSHEMTHALAGGGSVSEVLYDGDDTSDEIDDDRIDGEDLYEDGEAEQHDDTSEESWAGALLLIALFGVSNLLILGMLLFWVLRWLLVIMLGVGMPLFLALRAFEGTGIPLISGIGQKGWDLWWFATFMTIPAAITLRLGTVVSAFGDELSGTAGAAVGTVVGFLTTAGIPVFAAFVPLLFYKNKMSVPGVGNAEQLAGKGVSAAGSAKSAASGYASSTGDTRRERLADAVDESDSEVLNRAARRSSYIGDVGAGVTGRDRDHHDRYGRDTDAGGRSYAYNASNMFASAGSDNVDRDFNAEAAADAAGDDVSTEDIEDMDVSDDTTRTAAQEAQRLAALDQERESMKQRVDGADHEEMNTDFAQMYEAVQAGDIQALENSGVDTSQMLSDYEEQLMEEEMRDAKTGDDVLEAKRNELLDQAAKTGQSARDDWERTRDRLESKWKRAGEGSDLHQKHGSLDNYLRDETGYETAEAAGEAAVAAERDNLLQKYANDRTVQTIDDAVLKEAASENLDNFEDYNIDTTDALTEALKEETKATFAAQRIDKEDLKEQLADGIRESGGVAPGETIEEATQEELERWIGSDDWTSDGGDIDVTIDDPQVESGRDRDVRVLTPGGSDDDGSSQTTVVDATNAADELDDAEVVESESTTHWRQ